MPDALTAVPEDPGHAASLLKVRLVPATDIDASDLALVHREALPDVAGLLVFDLDDRLVPVGPADLEALSDVGDLDELWDLALDNVAAQDVPDIDVEELAAGIPVMVLQSESMFCATNALWPDRFLEVPPEGLLVGVPNRNLVWIHGVRDANVVPALAQLAVVGKARFDEVNEGQVSPDLFWWYDGTFQKIDSHLDEVDGESQLSLGLPDDLIEIFSKYLPVEN